MTGGNKKLVISSCQAWTTNSLRHGSTFLSTNAVKTLNTDFTIISFMCPITNGDSNNKDDDDDHRSTREFITSEKKQVPGREQRRSCDDVLHWEPATLGGG